MRLQILARRQPQPTFHPEEKFYNVLPGCILPGFIPKMLLDTNNIEAINYLIHMNNEE